MSWPLVIRIGGTLAGLTLIGLSIWSLSRWSGRHRLRRLESRLIEHLQSIGIRAERQRAQGTVVRTHEDNYAVTMRQLVTIRVYLRGVQEVEIWRITRKGESGTTTVDEITFVIVPKPGMSLNRIPILTNLSMTHTSKGKNRFRWRGFEWGRLPLLVDRLKVDTDLNNRLRGHFATNPPDNLRITAVDGNRIGITTGYDSRKPLTRDFLTCIEDIADHVHEYIAEQNRVRELQNSK